MADSNWHEARIRIRYKDTDRMGVVYYGNYLTFFEVGRAELMRDLGFPYAEIEADGYILVVTEANAKYHANVGYDSEVIVKTKIAKVRNASIRFNYEVVDEAGKLLVSGHTVHACLNSDLKPVRIPPDLKEVISKNIKSENECA
jgi:acyl-CoA thioester hydrolase